MADAPARPRLPPVSALDTVPADAFARAIGPLFEGAPRFVGRLAAARPFGTFDRLFERATEIALTMPEADRIELIDAHPRLGAPPGSVSALSFLEQGYGRDAAEAAAESDRVEVATELGRLNEAYESRFGFRYCTFVAGRSRRDLLPAFRAALAADRRAELERAVRAVIAIARDHRRKLAEAGEEMA